MKTKPIIIPRARPKPTALEVGAECARRTKTFFYDSSNASNLPEHAVDWYRGFCTELGTKSEPEIEALIIQKVKRIVSDVGDQTFNVIERLLADMPSPLGLLHPEQRGKRKA